MRVVVSALASPRSSGGMRLHAEEFVLAWLEEFPHDDVTVVGPGWTRELAARVAAEHRPRVVVWPNENALLRIFGEWLVVPLVARRRPDTVLLSLSPVMSPLARRRASYSFAHDWRHLRRPHQFSRAQRFYRRTWTASLRRVRAVFAISDKTLAETRALNPTVPIVLALNGRDHARRWQLVGTDRPSRRTLVTFGHKNHKRPDLAIEALAQLGEQHRDVELVVLGAVGGYREELRGLAAALGVQARCRFPGFVEQPDYERIVSAAHSVLLLSDDDGYGLPIAEAEFFGASGVVTSDGGLAGVHHDAAVTDPDPASLATVLHSLLDREPDAAARATSPGTWADTVRVVRAEIAGSAAGGRA